jgi:hypothetical protein
VLVLALWPAPLSAADGPHFETWSGITASENAWFAHGGIVAAPLGSVTEDGLRLRLQGGGGAYAYDGTMEVGDRTFDLRFLGQSTVIEALAGWQMRYGATIAKAFLGAVYDVRSVQPLAPDAVPEDPSVGGKAVIEAWHDWDEAIWASLDLSYATAGSVYDGNARLAYRVWPSLSLGIETGAMGNEDQDSARLGLLVKWDTAYGELMLSGGVSGDYLDASQPYGTLSVLSRF